MEVGLEKEIEQILFYYYAYLTIENLFLANKIRLTLSSNLSYHITVSQSYHYSLK